MAFPSPVLDTDNFETWRLVTNQIITELGGAGSLFQLSKLVASDGTPNDAVVVDADGNTDINYDLTVATDVLFVEGASGYVGINTLAPTAELTVTGDILATGDITSLSDVRVKDNITPLTNALETVMSIRGVSYTKYGKQEIGVIAQEIEKYIPTVVRTAEDERGTKSVDYGRIVAVLIEAIKEQQITIEELREDINELQSKQ